MCFVAVIWNLSVFRHWMHIHIRQHKKRKPSHSVITVSFRRLFWTKIAFPLFANKLGASQNVITVSCLVEGCNQNFDRFRDINYCNSNRADIDKFIGDCAVCWNFTFLFVLRTWHLLHLASRFSLSSMSEVTLVTDHNMRPAGKVWWKGSEVHKNLTNIYILLSSKEVHAR